MMGGALAFCSPSRLPDRNGKPSLKAATGKILVERTNLNGYRLGEVNSLRESRAPEKDSELSAVAQGAQPSARIGAVPGLFGADQQTERLSA
jgi:hypothetical protein